MRSSHVAIQFPRFRFRVISIARPFAPFTPALDDVRARAAGVVDSSGRSS